MDFVAKEILKKVYCGSMHTCIHLLAKLPMEKGVQDVKIAVIAYL